MIVQNHKKGKLLLLLVLLVVLLGSIRLYYPNNQNSLKNEIVSNKDFEKDLGLKPASQDTKGSPLLVTQYATISNTFFPYNLPTNVSFTLLEGWTSKNVTINYDEVSHQKDWVINGSFDNGNPWDFKSSDLTKIDQVGVSPNATLVVNKLKSIPKGSFGYFEENVSIMEPLSSNSFATLAMDYLYSLAGGGTPLTNVSAFLSISIGGVSKNISIPIIDIYPDRGTWNSMSVTYDLGLLGQNIPGNATIQAGIYAFNNTASTGAKENYLSIDNIQFEIWTNPNEPNLIVAKDVEFDQDYSYENITYGKGKSFIDVERTRGETSSIKFTISKNSTYVENLNIYNITIKSESFKVFNSTIDGLESSMYATNIQIGWQTECSFTIPYGYTDNWAEIMKPSDWNVTSILDGYNSEQRSSCTGYELGSGALIIPKGVLSSGLWTIKAVSQNYISDGSLNVYNGSAFKIKSSITLGDTFQINASLDGSVPYQYTFMNCSIEYPNGSLFYQSSEQLTSHDIEFGSFIVGKNMPVGSYNVILLWTNNQSYVYRDKVGYLQFNFNLWHHANLTPVKSYIESVSGEPLLVKVNYTDYDLDTYINLATVTYNSTLGISGTMVYFGSGIYAADIDTSGVGIGDYYFSFNASKTFYENQTEINLIKLTIVEQPLSLEFSSRVISTMGDSYAICSVTIEGEISKSPIWPANVSTDWDNGYSVFNHNNGTYSLNFSTNAIPVGGVIEAYEITVIANKTNYGSVSDSITLIVHPIHTVAIANHTNIVTYINENFDIRVNYTVEGSGELIDGGSCTVLWDSTYEISEASGGFIITYHTTGLNIDVYNSLITITKPGYEDAVVSITAVVNAQDTNISLQVNGNNVVQNSLVEAYFKEEVNLTARIFAEPEGAYLTDGSFIILSDNYQNVLIETQPTNFSLSIDINGENFSSGLNSIFLRYEKQNYTTAIFSFQFYIRAQNVMLEVEINHESIPENHLVEVFSSENLTVSCRAQAEIEGIYLAGGSVVLITDLNQISLSEYPNFWYNRTFTISPDLLIQGINYVYLKFDLTNYTTTTFSFQIYVRAQNVILGVKIGDQSIPENYLAPVQFNKNISISCNAFAEIEGKYISGGTINLIIDSNEIGLPEYPNFWYNRTFTISSDLFSLGINFVYLKFEHVNYTTTTFSIQIQVNQIEISVHPFNFTNSIEMYSGYNKIISIKLTESNSTKIIENATVICYSSEFGQFTFNYTGGGIYASSLGPFTVLGSHPFKLIITPKENLYKVSEYAFDIIISEKPVPPVPDYTFLLIIIGLIVLVGALGGLSVRSYVILPRRRKKRQLIAEKTQGYKDIRNIEAIIISSKASGMTLYNKTFSILDEDYITGFSGFIQAINILGKQYTKEGVKLESEDQIVENANEIKELDFNFFQSLICDHEAIRIILLLRNKSSERLRTEIEHLAQGLYSECKDLIIGFMGNLKALKTPFEEVIERHLPFYYKGPFTLNKDEHYQSMKISGDMSNLELRVLNVLESQSKYNKQFYLDDLFTKLLQNVNENSLIIAIESLIAQQLIIPHSQKYSLYLN